MLCPVLPGSPPSQYPRPHWVWRMRKLNTSREENYIERIHSSRNTCANNVENSLWISEMNFALLNQWKCFNKWHTANSLNSNIWHLFTSWRPRRWPQCWGWPWGGQSSSSGWTGASLTSASGRLTWCLPPGGLTSWLHLGASDPSLLTFWIHPLQARRSCSAVFTNSWKMQSSV